VTQEFGELVSILDVEARLGDHLDHDGFSREDVKHRPTFGVFAYVVPPCHVRNIAPISFSV